MLKTIWPIETKFGACVNDADTMLWNKLYKHTRTFSHLIYFVSNFTKTNAEWKYCVANVVVSSKVSHLFKLDTKQPINDYL